MRWSDFYDAFWDWPDPTRRARISALEDIGPGDEVVEAVLDTDDPTIREQLIRKAITLGAAFSTDDFQSLEDELPAEVYAELGQYAGFDADNPTYDPSDTSWSHFYDYVTQWSPALQNTAIKKLTQLGRRDELMDVIRSLDGTDQRTLLIRRAMEANMRFRHEDFENLQDELPADVYRELAAYTGCSADCPDYDKNNHTWKHFYENCSGWTEEIQLRAIASLNTVGSQRQVVETILELETDAPKRALIERSVQKSTVFTRESLRELDGNIPGDLFAGLLSAAGIPEDDLYFDESTMTWDDFEYSYCGWSGDLLARRIGKLKDFGDPESVCDVILLMPSSELEEMLYERALQKGVRFTREQLERMGRADPLPENAPDERFDRSGPLSPDTAVFNGWPDEEPVLTPEEQRRVTVKKVLKFLGLIVLAVLGVFAFFIKVIINLTKPYYGGSHRQSSPGLPGKTGSRKKKGSRCDGDCANCPAHFGYRYGRWYYGHGHQWGCERRGNGGASGRTYRD